MQLQNCTQFFFISSPNRNQRSGLLNIRLPKGLRLPNRLDISDQRAAVDCDVDICRGQMKDLRNVLMYFGNHIFVLGVYLNVNDELSG